MNNLIDVIEEQRSLIRSYNLMNEIAYSDVDVVIDRIIEATKQPRVMKRWTEDCKPTKEGVYWINEERFLISIDKRLIKSGLWKGSKIHYWLEVEQEPILP